MKRIYLDFNATTPVDQRVLEKMLPFFNTEFGNASSQHPYGWVAQKAVENARTQVAQLLNAPQSKDIIFTAGASESNNIAILGLAKTLISQKQKAHFITSQVEHHSVLEPMHAAEQLGVEVTYLPVNKFGQVEIESLKNALLPHTVLLSFMWANNEVGSLNPMVAISQLAQEKNLILHSDATQAIGKIPTNLVETKIDLLSISAHKLYGPKGVGALYISKSISEANQIASLIYGGKQERGFRAGTLNVPGIVGLGQACELAASVMPDESQHLSSMSQKFWTELKNLYPNLEWNGHPNQRLPGQMNFLFRGKRMDQILPRMVSLAMSSGSACASQTATVSHVLKAMGLSREEILASVRLSVGRTTTQEDLTNALQILKEHL